VSLTVKQQSFLEHYLACWNASEAVRRMGYTGTRANRAGEDYLSKPDIQAAIKQRLTELQMSADEVLTRLTSHARSSMAPFIRRDTDGDLYGFDLSETQPLHLIKKASVTRRKTERRNQGRYHHGGDGHDRAVRRAGRAPAAGPPPQAVRGSHRADWQGWCADRGDEHGYGRSGERT
jgi:hypothetical protein